MRNDKEPSLLRIALVITELDPGGAELCITELAIFLRAQGHEVGLWALGSPPQQQRAVLVDRAKQAGIDVQFGYARGGRDAWKCSRWLRRHLDHFSPDIVQSMLWHANVITGWALWGRKWPWVGGMRVSEPRRGRWWLERLASRRMQRLVCVSEDVKRHAIQRQGISPEILCVIRNGVSSRLLQLSEVPTPEPQNAPPTLLFVGRLEAQKGISGLSEHLPELMGLHNGWQLNVVGQGSLEPLLRGRVAAAGLTKCVHLVGWQADVPSWMRTSQLLILPALYEGMPNVLLEAMALGRPFVAFAVDGVKELLLPAQGYPGELAEAQTAPPDDWPALLKRAGRLMVDDHLRQRCGQANRQHVSQHFRLEDQLARYEAEYTAQLASSGLTTRPLNNLG